MVQCPFNLKILNNDNMQASVTSIENNFIYCYIAAISYTYMLYIFDDEICSYLHTFFSYLLDSP